MVDIYDYQGEERNKYDALFKAAPLGIYTVNAQGIIDTFNPEMVRLSGASGEGEVIGLNALTLSSYKEVGLTDYFKKGLDGKSFYIPCVKYKSYIGSKVSYRSYWGVPLYDEKGMVSHVLCMVLDITEKIEIEEARQRAMKLAVIIEKSPDAIVIVAPDERRTIEYWNQGAEQMFGWTSAEAIGQSVREFIMAEADRAEADEFLFRLKTEPLIHKEVNRVHKDGHLIPADLFMFPIRHESGVIIEIAAIMRDISERKKNEEQMIERDTNLKKMNDFMVGRELKMIELKEEVKALRKQLEELQNGKNTNESTESTT